MAIIYNITLRGGFQIKCVSVNTLWQDLMKDRMPDKRHVLMSGIISSVVA